MAETAIEWADDTVNLASGCTEHRRLDGSMDPACVNCYARLMSARCASMGQALYEGAAVRRGNTATWTGDLRWDPDLLDRRMDAIRPGKITFLGSMTDLWHERADPAMWAALAAAARRISARPAKRWPRGVVTLTKRTDGLLVFQREHFPEGLPAWWWPGCTVADQIGVNLRAADLMRVNFEVPKGDDGIRVVSYEPAMGPVDLDPFLWVCPTCGPGGKADGDGGCYHCNEPLRSIGWLIAGGESGPKARPSHPDWFRAARDACVAAGVPFFFKQWGEWAPICAIGETNHLYHPAPKRHPDGTRRCRVPELILRADGNHRRAGDPESFRSDRPGWPAMHAFKVGKHAAGRMLDGVVHDAYPQVPGGTP